jgi:hypothetical protein
MGHIILLTAAFILGGIMISGCSNSTANLSENIQGEKVVDAQKGREFSSLSVYPNGEELLFVEVDEKRLHSKVLRYNSKSGSLQHYNFPDEAYVYLQAKMSPSGKYIVMTRIPRLFSDYEAKMPNAMESAEIAIMKADGTDFKVLKLSPGFKHNAIVSNDDSKVAYWRGSLRPSHSKTLANRLDLWEVDLKTGADTLFAGPFEFFECGQMQYLPGNGEILATALAPRVQGTKYLNKYNWSSVYKISRGQTNVPDPILTEFKSANYPVTDRAGNLYFRGERPGTSLFKKTPQGEIKQWEMTAEFVNIISSGVAPDGSYVVFIYSYYGKGPSLRGVGMLDTKTSQWGTLSIPPWDSSSPIAVKE